MFVKYFRLAEQPFGATPDPRFLFQSHSHREALASLYCSFYANRGFTALIAEPGMGKTTLLFEFLEHVRNCAKTVFLCNTLCGFDDIVAYILRDSGIEPGSTVMERHQQITGLLGAEARRHSPVVLVIDEAQNLSPHTLEGIRLLTNFETTRAKLIQVILAGQPQLSETLARPDLAQLRQRICTICRIAPLSAAETRTYIQHRLTFAGCKGNELFTPSACDLIAKASSGIPRVINTLSFNTLSLCHARRSQVVDEAIVNEAIADLELKTEPPARVYQPAAERALPRVSDAKGLTIRLRSAVPLYASALMLAALAVLFGYYLRPSSSMARSKPVPAVVSDVAPPQRMHPPGQLLSATAIAGHPGSPEPQDVKISSGDTLERIATTNLGTFNGSILRQIRALNPQITNPDHIESGRTLRLPSIGSGTGMEAPGSE